MNAARLGVVACALVSCTTFGSDRVNPEKPGWFSRPTGDMTVMFRRSLTIDGRKVGEDYERGRPEIDPAGHRVFVGSADHGLYALRAFDGSSIWRFETAGAVQSEPLYDAELDVLYFGSNDGALYAVRAADGGLIWRFNSGSEVSKRPALSGNTLIFANASDQFFAIDRTSGKQKWEVHRTPALGMEIGGYGAPVVERGRVFIVFSDGHVGAYDVGDGTEKWLVDLSAEAEQTLGARGEVERYLDIDTTPIMLDIPGVGGAVVAASYAGGIYALDVSNGAHLWANTEARGVHEITHWHERAHTPHAHGPDRGGPVVPARDIVFAASSSTGLWALEPATGKKIWRLPVPEGGITAPVAVAGAIAVGTTRYGLFLLSPTSGHVIDALNLESGFAATPAAWGNRLFALSSAGTFLGIGIDPPLGKR